MSEKINLNAIVREGKLADTKDSIAGVVYGSGSENISLAVKRNEFEGVFATSGESGLVMLNIDGKGEVPVIIKDLQFDPVKHRIIHVDFYKVNMNEKVTAEVSLNFIGEAPAVKSFGAMVATHFDTLEIECLPGDLMQKMDIDVSHLENIGDAIHVSDIKLPKGITIKNDPSEIVVQVVEPSKADVIAPVAAAEAVPAEGAAAPAADAKDVKPEAKK